MRKGRRKGFHKGQNEKQIIDRATLQMVCKRNELATNPFGTIICVQVYKCESHIPFLGHLSFWLIVLYNGIMQKIA